MVSLRGSYACTKPMHRRTSRSFALYLLFYLHPSSFPRTTSRPAKTPSAGGAETARIRRTVHAGRPARQASACHIHRHMGHRTAARSCNSARWTCPTSSRYRCRRPSASVRRHRIRRRSAPRRFVASSAACILPAAGCTRWVGTAHRQDQCLGRVATAAHQRSSRSIGSPGARQAATALKRIPGSARADDRWTGCRAAG